MPKLCWLIRISKIIESDSQKRHKAQSEAGRKQAEILNKQRRNKRLNRGSLADGLADTQADVKNHGFLTQPNITQPNSSLEKVSALDPWIESYDKADVNAYADEYKKKSRGE